MSNKTDNASSEDRLSATDQILDLLLDALVERQKARRAAAAKLTPPPPPKPKASGKEQPVVPPPRPEPPPSDQQRTPPRPTPSRPTSPPSLRRAPQPGEEGWEPPARQPSIQMGKMIGRLAILVIVLIVAVNIPVTRYGVSLARILPETTSLIIRDGLILKGSSPEIYMLEADKLRWISSMDAFEHLGLTWEDVHVVEDEFLTRFEKGRPIHVLLKCRTSPHIYRLENQEKRWIKDIDTFLAEGHVWEDVRFVGCNYLRDIPDGPPIPEDAGPPPQP
jgi:hypothetical protein